MKIIGHRGAKGLAPENTIASMRKALDHNVDEIEFDVRLTRDDVPILLHDPHLVDPAGNELEILKTDFDELKQHKPDLATLEEALSAIGGRVPVIVEIKPHVPAQQIIAILKELPAEYRISVASYDYSLLRTVHSILPDMPLIVIENWSSWRARRRMKKLSTNRVSMLEYWLWGGYIWMMSRAGYELCAFPPKKQRRWARLLLGEHTNSPTRARKWAKAGLSGVITDFPDRFEK